VTLAVQSNAGGPAEAAYIWQNVSDPTKVTIIKQDEKPVWSSTVAISKVDLGSAPMNIYSMLISLLPTADVTVWAWARQNGIFLPAVDGGGNPIRPQGPHEAIQVGPASQGQTTRETVSVAT
jgi:hypothetical protein